MKYVFIIICAVILLLGCPSPAGTQIPSLSYIQKTYETIVSTAGTVIKTYFHKGMKENEVTKILEREKFKHWRRVLKQPNKENECILLIADKYDWLQKDGWPKNDLILEYWFVFLQDSLVFFSIQLWTLKY